MNKELEFETYLSISPYEFEIYLLDKKNLNNLYENKLIIKHPNNFINFNLLTVFLDKNIFKIEKMIGMFVENIVLIIDNNKVINLNFSIKKKNYQNNISKNFLESMLIDAKDLFAENYHNQKIMHLIIKKYIIDGNQYLLFNEKLNGDKFCIEVQFISISNKFLFEIDKVLEKYQIKIIQYFDGNYIRNLFKNQDIHFAEMIYKVQNGFIENEVKLIPKNRKNLGFFEKFFQLFS